MQKYDPRQRSYAALAYTTRSICTIPPPDWQHTWHLMKVLHGSIWDIVAWSEQEPLQAAHFMALYVRVFLLGVKAILQGYAKFLYSAGYEAEAEEYNFLAIFLGFGADQAKELSSITMHEMERLGLKP